MSNACSEIISCFDIHKQTAHFKSYYDRISRRAAKSRNTPITVPVVNNFHSVTTHIVSQRPFVICDIDETAITFKRGFPSKGLNLARESAIMPTDKIGFHVMLKKIEDAGGKLVFLTARNEENHQMTCDDLRILDIDPDKYEIHYTNNRISKGEYILVNMFMQTWYKELYFIDDQRGFIASVIDHVPNAKCIRFDYEYLETL